MKQVLVVSSSRNTRRYVTRSISSTGFMVQHAAWNRDEIQGHLSPQYQMYIIDADGNEDDARWMIGELLSMNGQITYLLLSRKHATPFIHELITTKRMSNLIAKHRGKNTGEVIDEVELMVTCQKLFFGDIFGLEKYLSGSTRQVHQHEILESKERKTVFASLESWLDCIDCGDIIKEAVMLTAEELVMNAIFNAPRQENGTPKYTHKDRKAAICLGPRERVLVRYACDGRYLSLSVSDRFGSLDRDLIVKYLQRSFIGRTTEMERKPAGAGIGLHMVFNSCTQLIFNIDPGVSSEVIARFYIRSGPLGFKTSGHSFNLFWEASNKLA